MLTYTPVRESRERNKDMGRKSIDVMTYAVCLDRRQSLICFLYTTSIHGRVYLRNDEMVNFYV
jgi:hypothetical protein